MAPKTWDVYDVLEIDRTSLYHCIGTAKTYNRRCRVDIDDHNQSDAMDCLRRLNQSKPSAYDKELGAELLKIASLLLCPKWHRNQARVMVENWRGRIESWVATEQLVYRSTSVRHSILTSPTDSAPQSPEMSQPSYTVLLAEQQTSHLRSSKRYEQPATWTQNSPELHKAPAPVSSAANNPVSAEPSQPFSANPPSQTPGLESIPSFSSTFDYGAALNTSNMPFSNPQPPVGKGKARVSASSHHSTSTLQSPQGDFTSTSTTSFIGVAPAPSELPADPIPVVKRHEKAVPEQTPLSTFDVDALIASEIGTSSKRSVSREIPQDTLETIPASYHEDVPAKVDHDTSPSSDNRSQKAYPRRKRTARILKQLRGMQIR